MPCVLGLSYDFEGLDYGSPSACNSRCEPFARSFR